LSAFPSTDAHALHASLSALQAGDLAAWHPLPESATAADLAAAAPSAEPVVENRLLLGQPASSVQVPGGRGSPFGVVVWLQHGHVTLVEVREPVLTPALTDALGPPELTLPSGLAPIGEQMCWPSVVLTVHRQADDRLLMLYGYAPMSPEAMRDAPLARVSAHRTPR
jgi:hypothetical protein